jgi:hypothetical protein
MDVELQCAFPKLEVMMEAAGGDVIVVAIEYVGLAVVQAPVVVLFQSCS